MLVNYWVILHWRKLIFPFASWYQFHTASWLVVACVYSLSQSWHPPSLNLHRSYAGHHSICEFRLHPSWGVWKTLFPWSHPYLCLSDFLSPPLHRPWALREGLDDTDVPLKTQCSQVSDSPHMQHFLKWPTRKSKEKCKCLKYKGKWKYSMPKPVRATKSRYKEGSFQLLK